MPDETPAIITATPNICWLEPETDYPTSVEELVAEAKLCEQAGASILHFHGEEHWTEALDALRAETDLILQCGMSSLPIPERMEVFEQRADMISIITSHHDEAFVEVDVHVLHPREELAEYAELSRRFGTKLELETWHSGSIWNIEWMIERGLLDPPYFASIFFGWPGGSWSPVTVEEFEYRRRLLPDDTVATVSAMGPDQFRLLCHALGAGDHVRVGTEDYPRDRYGEPAQTHELVAQIAAVADSIGRSIATPQQAREITGIPARVS
ncbi:3-keto-5-aminohexanoate cleavage protein [Thermoleophilia bacterium SCSIO 60948]|nr:3-keto-5-aminohexanoate cleavage protein [Thermoleophilia bacterium SCSIO 60948]